MTHHHRSEREEAYFHQRDLEQRRAVREKMEAAARELQEARGVAKTAGIESLELAERIRRLGFSGETAMVLDLLPLVLVAWADGSVSRAERATVLTVLDHRGIARDSEAFAAIAALLEEKPSDAFMAESLSIVRELMAGRAEAQSAELMELCALVADASGGVLGLARRVSAEERRLMGEIAQTLGTAAQDRLKALL